MVWNIDLLSKKRAALIARDTSFFFDFRYVCDVAMGGKHWMMDVCLYGIPPRPPLYEIWWITYYVVIHNLLHLANKFSAIFYRAMHFSAKRGIAIACRLSVRLSVTLVDCDHIGWNSSKIISPLVSLGCSVFAIATPTWRVCSKGNTPKFGPQMTHPLLIWASETFDRKLRPNGYR